jgi:hypothetical protein
MKRSSDQRLCDQRTMGIGLTRDFLPVGVRRQRHGTLAAEGRGFVFLQLPAGPVEKHEVTRGLARLAEANQASQRRDKGT